MPSISQQIAEAYPRVGLSQMMAQIEELKSDLTCQQEQHDRQVGHTESPPPVISFSSFSQQLPALHNSDHSKSFLTNISLDDSLRSSHEDSRRNLWKTSKFLGLSTTAKSITDSTECHFNMDPEFDSMFHPNDMRLLALSSHNNMKHAMKQFVMANKNVLKKFRLTGTSATMDMLKEVFGNDLDIIYGPSCRPGPLGGDAQLVAMAATTGQLGGCIFFMDPLESHPHAADIECLNRQGNVHNILMMPNPNTAHICLNALRVGLKLGQIEMMPSFFFDLESPSVESYKNKQKHILENAIQKREGTRSLHNLLDGDSDIEVSTNANKTIAIDSSVATSNIEVSSSASKTIDTSVATSATPTSTYNSEKVEFRKKRSKWKMKKIFSFFKCFAA